MATNTLIQIKRSTGSTTPTLAAGELAYSAALSTGVDAGLGKLYIGSPGNTATLAIGGTFYTSKIDGVTAGTAAASKAVILDANSSVSGLGTVGATTFTGTVLTGSTSVAGGNLKLSGNTVESTNANGDVNINPNGTGLVQIYGGDATNSWSLPRERGTANYVLTTNANGTTSWAQPVSTLSFSNGTSTSTVNLLTQTFSLLGGTGITTSVSGQSVTIDIDTGEGGLVTTTGTQTLTNKTMDGNSNTFTNIGNGSLVNSSVTINGQSLSLGSTLTLTTTNIGEGTNLYFTQARARESLSGTETAGDLGGGSYNTTTGAITFNKIANSEVRGLLSSTTTDGTGFGSLSYNSGTGAFTFSQVTAANVRGTLAAANSGSGYGSLAYDSATGTYTFTVVTDANIRERISATNTNAGGYGELSYNSSTGALSFARVTNADIRGSISLVSTATAGTPLDSLTYDGTGGTFTFTAVTDAQVRNLFSAGTSGSGFGDLQYTTATGALTLTKVSVSDVRGTLGAANSGTGHGSLSYDSGTGTYTFAVVTDANIRGAISVANSDTSTFGSLSYGGTGTGQISYTGVSAANIRGTLSGGTGVTYDSGTGAISIGQAVGTTDNVTFNKVTISTSTFASSDAVTKSYVDSVAQGLDAKASVVAATTASITLSNTQTIDGVSIVAGNRVLVKDQADPTENGIWVASASAWTRADDMSTGDEFPGAFTFVEQGTTWADTGWVCSTNSPVTVGTTPITWVQFSAAGQYTASNGLVKVGNDFQIASSAAGDGLSFASGVLSVNVNTATLQITGDTIDIKAQGVTNAMLQNSSTTFNGGAGTVNVDLGSALTITGSSPVSTAIAGSTLTISVAEATTSSLGVASFSNTNFSVLNGAVSIKSGGVDLTTNVTGVLPVANGGSGLATITTNGVVIGAGTSPVTTATGTQYQLLTVGAGGVPAFGAVSLDQGGVAVTGTLAVAHGGTGRASLTATQLLIGDGTNAVAQSGDLTFAASGTTGANELTVGTAKIATTGSDVIITATGTNGNVILAPNGTGIVSIGGPNSGSSSLGTSAGETLNISSGAALNLTAATTMTLTTTSSDIVMALANTSTYKVSISGPSAATYADGIADNDLVNALWVQNYVATIDGGTY